MMMKMTLTELKSYIETMPENTVVVIEISQEEGEEGGDDSRRA